MQADLIKLLTDIGQAAIPILIVFGVLASILWTHQIRSKNEQLRAKDAQITTLKERIDSLQQTQYPDLREAFEAQREFYEQRLRIEREAKENAQRRVDELELEKNQKAVVTDILNTSINYVSANTTNAAIKLLTVQKTCSRCGYEYPSGREFCPKCGSSEFKIIERTFGTDTGAVSFPVWGERKKEDD